jgi:hypothetical protein
MPYFSVKLVIERHMLGKTLLLVLTCTYAFAFSQSAAWQPLFNGKDFKGWKQLNGKAKYSIENGEIVGTTVFGEPNSFLATEKDYGDFILELEFKVDSRMNSGVQFRSQSRTDYKEGKVHGYQFEIDPSRRGWTGGIYDESRRDWLYPLDLNPGARTAFKNGQWNKCRIECIGNSIRTFINGKAAAYLVDDATSKGFIALQVHSVGKKEEEGRHIRWRNIRIQTQNLKASPPERLFVLNLLPNQLSEQEKRNEVKLLWDGKTTNGWRGAYKESFPEKGWKIADGTLSVLPSGGGESTHGGDIITNNQYSSFILQFDFKLSEGANSGVKYFVTEKEKNSGSAIGLEYQILDDAKTSGCKNGSCR